MARVEKTIEVNVPVRQAYNQWTQFESFPQFMEGVQEVRQLDDKRLHWKAKVGTKVEEWDAEIREQVPDEKIIWKNTTGAENAGMVKFDSLGADKTRVHLEMSYDPEGFIETVGDKLGFFSRRVEGDLERFKDFIESRGQETGAWRGTIQNEKAPGGHTQGSLDAGEGRGSSPGHKDDGTRFERGGGGGSSSFNEPDRASDAGMRGTGATMLDQGERGRTAARNAGMAEPATGEMTTDRELPPSGDLTTRPTPEDRARMSEQQRRRPEMPAGGQGAEYRDESDPSWRPTGAGDIASGNSAMEGTTTGTAYDSETGSGYTAMGMTGSSGGSMQGGGNTSYGNAGAGSSTASSDLGYANDPEHRGLTGSAYRHPGDVGALEDEAVEENAGEGQMRGGDFPSPGDAPGGSGGEFPDRIG